MKAKLNLKAEDYPKLTKLVKGRISTTSKQKAEKIAPLKKSKIMEEISTAVIVTDLEKKAKPYFGKLAKITEIKTQEDFDQAGINLKFLKNIAAQAEEMEEGMTKPIRDGARNSIAKIKQHFTPFRSKILNLETAYKLKMSLFLEKGKKKIAAIEEKFEQGNMSVATFAKKISGAAITSRKDGAKTRNVWTAVVVEEKKIPREFLIPDMAAITKAFREDPTRKIAGVEWKQVEQIAI